jgi:Concanavalin A-like lectin/glucanases superfamily
MAGLGEPPPSSRGATRAWPRTTSTLPRGRRLIWLASSLPVFWACNALLGNDPVSLWAGDAGADACQGECARDDGGASLTNDGALPDASADARPEDGGAVDAGSDTGRDTGPGGPSQPVGGQLSGLTPGESITLQDNSGDSLTLSSNGTFTFAAPVEGGRMYDVTILSAPASPIAQTCTVSNGTGTIGTAPVTDVTVNCDLLVYFPFSGNANDESGYGHDGVVSGATLTADRSGNANGAYGFSSDATVQATEPVGFLPVNGEPRTLAAWLKPTQSNSALDVVFWGAGDCTGLQFGLGDNGDNAAFWGGCDDYSSALPLPVGEWTFVAVVYSPTTPTSIVVYVNDLTATGTITALTTSGSGSFVMGGSVVAGSPMFFTGDIDSVRVYGHALQPAEVASLFAASDP